MAEVYARPTSYVLIHYVADGARVFEAAKTGFESSGPVGRNLLFQSFLLKDLWVPGPKFLIPRVFF